MPCQQEVTLPVSFITTVMPIMLQIFNTKEVSYCLYKMAYLTKNLPSYLFVACSHLDLADGGAWFSQQMKRCQDCWASCNAAEWTPLSSPGGGKTCRALLMTAKNMQPPKHKGDCLKKHKETHPAPKKKKKKGTKTTFIIVNLPSLVPHGCTESTSQGPCQLWSLNITAARNTINNSQKNKYATAVLFSYSI